MSERLKEVKIIKEIVDSCLNHAKLNKRCLLSANQKKFASNEIVLVLKKAFENEDFSVSEYCVCFSKEDASNIELIHSVYLAIKEFLAAASDKNSLINVNIKELEIDICIIEEKLVTKSGIFLNEKEIIPYFPQLKYSLELIKPQLKRLASGEINISNFKEELKFRLSIELNEYVPDVSELGGKILTVRLPKRFYANNLNEVEDRQLNTRKVSDAFRTYTLELKMVTTDFQCKSDIFSGDSSSRWILEEL